MSWLKRIPKLLSCEHYTELESKRLDEASLSGFDKVCHAFHKIICLCCRRFSRQLGLIEKVASSMAAKNAVDEHGSKSESFQGLSDESREKIAAALVKEQH